MNVWWSSLDGRLSVWLEPVGKGKGRGKGMSKEDLDKQLEEYMGPEAVKGRLDADLLRRSADL